jgi:hypothetical protein
VSPCRPSMLPPLDLFLRSVSPLSIAVTPKFAAKPFIYRIYANTPWVWGYSTSRFSPVTSQRVTGQVFVRPLFSYTYELPLPNHRFSSLVFSATYELLFSQLRCFQIDTNCPMCFSMSPLILRSRRLTPLSTAPTPNRPLNPLSTAFTQTHGGVGYLEVPLCQLCGFKRGGQRGRRCRRRR